MTATPSAFGWVEQARQDLAAEFTPRAERALDRWAVQVDEVTLADVPCQRLLPKDARPFATLLYFFGGGHVSGCPEFDLPITAPLCVEAGLQIIAPQYALAPEDPFPTALEQAKAVWPAICGALEGGHPLVAGESAGGNLALALTHWAIATGQTAPAKLALLSPWCDLTSFGIALSDGTKDPTLPANQISAYAAAYLHGHDAADPAASPLKAHVPQGWPPTHLTTGTRDALRPTVLALHDKLRAAGADVSLIDAPDMWHVFEAYDEAPQAAQSLSTLARFLRP